MVLTCPGGPMAHLMGKARRVWLVCLDVRACRARGRISRRAKKAGQRRTRFAIHKLTRRGLACLDVSGYKGGWDISRRVKCAPGGWARERGL